ncbi:MAG: hypothetical protein IPK75_07110 [Acidobacteria bacterium]|jgi:SH3-like domain-containing protein|nr:hypothetical protein [Acidobacteriota bacterium]
MKRAVLALTLLVSSACVLPVAADPLPEVQISRFSDKPVPRFEALRHEKVNGRMGPSEDYKVQWEYTRKGLPVLILKESGAWRYVRDPSGDEVWIKGNQLTDRPTAVTTDAFVLRAGRAGDSASVADIGKGVLVEVQGCEAEMCQITAGAFRGWAPRTRLWGASETKG